MGHSRANPAPSDQSPRTEVRFDDGMDEGALLDMISGIESRLGDLRDATLSLPEHDAPPPPPSQDRIIETVQSPEHGASLARREELDRRERDISEREQLLLAQTERIDHECRQLEQARVLLTEQKETYAQRGLAIREAREDLDRRAADLDKREAELSGRASAFEAQSGSVLATQSELDERASLLDAREGELEQLRVALTQQQEEMERDSEQYAQLQGDMAGLFERLSEAEAHAIKNATSTEANPELESRWRSLEQECTRLKRELSTTRKTLRETETQKKSITSDPAPMRIALSRRGRASGVLCAGWCVAAAVLAMGALLGLLAGMPGAGVSLLGGVFAAYFVASSHVAKRLVTPSTIAFAILASTFGLWIPIWTEGITEALALWDVPLSFVPSVLHSTTPQAIAILTSGLVMAWAIFLVTSSATNFGAAFTATLVATPIALVPLGPVPLVIAAILWNAIIAAALTRWALNAIDEETSALPTLPPLGNVPRRPTV